MSATQQLTGDPAITFTSEGATQTGIVGEQYLVPG